MVAVLFPLYRVLLWIWTPRVKEVLVVCKHEDTVLCGSSYIRINHPVTVSASETSRVGSA